ncbi:hypothetical protein M5J15_00150 [Serratia symbiotica]|uniref:hypothetical protein n=1 Tax=Serratia symbiotica TaxID=138074 RepID=UPI001DC50F1B|nr:hypothetical protein [Serratia symbiotica]NIG88583.1 hypothetical protein [Serratia symbiotica]USS95758.1 hypothetical protein M5J15_00150 [Serratia symbiotica]
MKTPDFLLRGFEDVSGRVQICIFIASATSQKGDLSRLEALTGMATPPHHLS